jgi:hypothetical protein
MLSQTAARGLGRQVKAQLLADCLLRAANTVSSIEGCLPVGDFVEVWHHLKGWYQLAEDQALKEACPETLAHQTVERVELYRAVLAPGWLLPINITSTPVPNGPPMDAEIREVVGKLWNGHTLIGCNGDESSALKGVATWHQV